MGLPTKARAFCTQCIVLARSQTAKQIIYVLNKLLKCSSSIKAEVDTMLVKLEQPKVYAEYEGRLLSPPTNSV